MKKQEEKEAEREERGRLREERRVERGLAEERARLDKERSHLLNALNAIRASGQADPDLELRLEAIDEAIAQNDFRAANIRAGYIYVISNRGAFGEDVVTEKVGNLLEFSEYAEATEYLQSINLWPARPSLGPAAEAQHLDL